MNNKFSAKILGIDYGRRKLGIAVGERGLSEPYKVIRVGSFEDAVSKVIKIIKAIKADKVVVGISEGKMAKETKRFAESIRQTLSPVPIVLFDETLTSKDAQKISFEMGVKRIKRRQMEDAYAASIMLQNYLDSWG